MTHFSENLEALEKAITNAVAVSEKAMVYSDGTAEFWGAILHARVILNAGSIINVIEAATSMPPGKQLLDHFSVASIARTALEAGIMMLYITDETSDDFEMRQAIFLYHDTCHRSRMFKGVEKENNEIREMRRVYKQKIHEIRSELEAMPKFRALPSDAKERILAGRDFFVGGVRGALRRIGFPAREYDFFESYFSGYVHSMPSSFLRVEQHKVDFANISEFQFDLCGTAMSSVSVILKRTTDRMNDIINLKLEASNSNVI